MKVKSTEGKSGFLIPGTELTSTSESFAGGFCIIRSKGASSWFDTLVDAAIEGGRALDVDMPVYIDAFASVSDNPLEEGDVVIPFDMSVSCWTKDCANNASMGTEDVSDQCDYRAGRRDNRPDGLPSESGTINGWYETDSRMQRAIEALFRAQIVHSGTKAERKITYMPRSQDAKFWHFLVIRETTTVGEVERTLIRNMTISGFSADESYPNYIPFNFNYTTNSSFDYSREVGA